MRHVSPLLTLGTLALTACDPQLSPLYTGESLLTITGRVEISSEHRDSLVLPAFAFVVPNLGAVKIREVAVQGQFPSDFRLDVYEPPPRDAYFNATHQTSGEPRLAAAYVTAVANDHPDTIRSATYSTLSSMGCEPSLCDQPCGGKGCLVSQGEYCVQDDPSVPCYVEATYCPTYNSPEEQCTTEPVSGDPALKESPWRTFAGFSQNYVVVFLEKPAPAGSVTAAILGSPEGVEAGYGLYAMRPPTELEATETMACSARAEIRAADGFNQEYGTKLTTLAWDLLCPPQDLGAAPEEIAGPFCAGTDDEIDVALEARERYIERAKRDLGCQMRDIVVERVAEPENESVSVIIGPGAQPVFWPN